MKKLSTILLALTLATVGQAAWAVSEQAQTVQDATAVINDFVNIPENAIPPALLSQAYGIAIIPGVIKAGFVVGGRYGEGIMSVRTADGTWSHPVFITLVGASVGWQIGAASSDIILVFKTQRGVDQIVDGQVTLGGDISVAAGPFGRAASAATNLRLDAEIYSYSRSRGLFAGIALEGGVITIDEEDDWRYYGDMLDAGTILHNNNLKALPKTGERLIYTLNRYMPPMNRSGGPIPYGNVGAGADQSGSSMPGADAQALPRDNSDIGQAQPYGDAGGQPYGNSQVPIRIQSRQQPQATYPRNEQALPPAADPGAAGSSYGPVYDTSGGSAGSAANQQAPVPVTGGGNGD